MSDKYLFLDDVRMPEDAYEYTKFELLREKEWDVVRSFNAFIWYIEENGVPKFISFDHDLADSHYTPKHLWCDYNKSKEWQERKIHKEKTGYDCAVWIVEHCINNNIDLPEYYCHSMNPVGRDKIIKELECFEEKKMYRKISTNQMVDILESIWIPHTDITLDGFKIIMEVMNEKYELIKHRYKRGMRKSYNKHKKKKS